MWDGAVALAFYLERLPPSIKQSISKQGGVLELGSGTGLAGLAAAAALGLPVTLTDLPNALPALERNVNLQTSQLRELITVAPCDWNLSLDIQSPLLAPPWGLIIASDCVWVAHLVEPFVTMLERLVTQRGDAIRTRVLISHQMRSSVVDQLLFSLLKKSFRVTEASRLLGEPDRGNVDIYWLDPL